MSELLPVSERLNKPRLRATVLHGILCERGFVGSAVQVCRVVRTLRPSPPREAFLRLHSLPGEAGQVDWADCGPVWRD